MIDIITLINNIFLILNLYIPGHIYLTAYRWASFSKEKYNTIFFIKCIVLSYIFTILGKTIFQTEQLIAQHLFIICCISFILGLFCGIFVRSNLCHKIFSKVKLDRSLCNNIWVETIQGNDYIRVFQSDGTSYIGLCKRIEEDNREPIIVLYNYQFLDVHGNIVINMEGQFNEWIMLNTKDFTKIEIIKHKYNINE